MPTLKDFTDFLKAKGPSRMGVWDAAARSDRRHRARLILGKPARVEGECEWCGDPEPADSDERCRDCGAHRGER